MKTIHKIESDCGCCSLSIVQNFGEFFVVRVGAWATDRMFELKLDACVDEDVRQCMITRAETDGEDGLYWTNWEDCKAEHLEHDIIKPWVINGSFAQRMYEKLMSIGMSHDECEIIMCRVESALPPENWSMQGGLVSGSLFTLTWGLCLNAAKTWMETESGLTPQSIRYKSVMEYK